MSTIGMRIKEIREKSGYSQTDMAGKIGVSKQTLYKYENGIVTNIPSDKIENIAKLCRVSPAYIMGWEDSAIPDLPNITPITTTSIPLLGSVACGKPIYAEQDFVCYVEVGADIHADYGLRARGDSMINARIHDGDIVFVKKTDTVENGDIAVVLIQDEATLKRFFYYPEKQKLVLQAENPKYEPLVYVGEELAGVRVLGKAIAFQSDIEVTLKAQKRNG